MRAIVMYGAGDVQVRDVPDPKLQEPTDAIVRVLRSCICGSDLWPYGSMPETEGGRRIGHEFLGVVEETGAEVSGLRAGDVVLAPFVWADNTCVFCREGWQTSCRHGGQWAANGVDGGQGEAVRVPQAQGTLVRLPVAEDSALRGDEGIERVRELTGGYGTHAVLERVGLKPAIETAFGVVRDGGTVSRVGAPQYREVPMDFGVFLRNITLTGGVAPARAYIDELMPDVLDGVIEPGRVFDQAVSLDGVPGGYRAMADRQALKVLIHP
jgi:threonine dehydrogenase-like Zn-dependent dehydrogenase